MDLSSEIESLLLLILGRFITNKTMVVALFFSVYCALTVVNDTLELKKDSPLSILSLDQVYES